MNKIKYFMMVGLCLLSSCMNDKKALNYFNPEFKKASEIRFVREPKGEDYWQTPKETENLGTGDCEDITKYLEYLLKKSGKFCRCEEKIGHYDGLSMFFAPESGHVWIECGFKGNKYILDPSLSLFDRKSNHKNNYLDPDSSLQQPYLEEKIKEYGARIGR